MSEIAKQTIHIDALDKRPDLPDCGETGGKCPQCGSDLQTGFGLAGGGYGVYEYCYSETCNRVVTKTQTPLVHVPLKRSDCRTCMPGLQWIGQTRCGLERGDRC